MNRKQLWLKASQELDIAANSYSEAGTKESFEQFVFAQQAEQLAYDSYIESGT